MTAVQRGQAGSKTSLPDSGSVSDLGASWTPRHARPRGAGGRLPRQEPAGQVRPRPRSERGRERSLCRV